LGRERDGERPGQRSGLLTADTLNLNGGGNVGVNAGNRLNTVVNTLALNKSGGDTFLSEADALNAQGTTPGNLTLDAGATTVNAAGLSAAGGALTASALTLNGALNLGVGSVTVNGPASGAGLLTADTLNLNGGGNVGVNAGTG